MKKVTKSEISERVQALHDNNEQWHYHLLTPNCQFNDSQQYAIFVENVRTQEVFVYYSNKAEMDLSNEFSKMLHGNEVMDQNNTKSDYQPNQDVAAILDLIKDLTKQGIKWHHHVFFPGCAFNSQEKVFELVVEDPRGKDRLVSVSDSEPKEDLKQIESVFYAQDTA